MISARRPAFSEGANARTEYFSETEGYLVDGYVETNYASDTLAIVVGVFKLDDLGVSWAEIDVDSFENSLTEDDLKEIQYLLETNYVDSTEFTPSEYEDEKADLLTRDGYGTYIAGDFELSPEDFEDF